MTLDTHYYIDKKILHLYLAYVLCFTELIIFFNPNRAVIILGPHIHLGQEPFNTTIPCDGQAPVRHALFSSDNSCINSSYDFFLLQFSLLYALFDRFETRNLT